MAGVGRSKHEDECGVVCKVKKVFTSTPDQKKADERESTKTREPEEYFSGKKFDAKIDAVLKEQGAQ